MANLNIIVEVTTPVGEGVGAIPAPEMSDQEAHSFAERIGNTYRVAVDERSPGCCIDGRNCVHASEPRAKVAGGPLMTAYAALESTGYFTDDSMDTLARLQRTAEMLEQAGIVLGGHGDMEAAAEQFKGGKSGCGANDKFPEIMANIGKAESFVMGGTEMLLSSDTYNPALAKEQVKHTVENPISDWQAVYMVDVLGGASEARPNGALEVLQTDESPTHGHHEIMVLVNYLENTTIDRDAMVRDGEPQVFVIDAWYIAKIANALARGPELKAQAAMLTQAMVAYQVATLYTLGDGSHRVAKLQAEPALV